MNDTEHWHMHKGVGYANLISTLILLLAVIASASTFTARVAVLESTIAIHAQALRDIRVDQSHQFRELTEMIRQLDNKLDNKLDSKQDKR